jgi:hypothetical protein
MAPWNPAARRLANPTAQPLARSRPAHPFTACPRRLSSPVGPPQRRRVPDSIRRLAVLYPCSCSGRLRATSSAHMAEAPRLTPVDLSSFYYGSGLWACVDNFAASRSTFLCSLQKPEASPRMPLHTHRIALYAAVRLPVAKRRSLLCAAVAPSTDESAAQHGRHSQVHYLCLS